LCYNVILQALFMSAQHIYQKRESSGPRSGSATLTNGSGTQKHADPQHCCLLFKKSLHMELNDTHRSFFNQFAFFTSHKSLSY
jgi:hypothetical protein